MVNATGKLRVGVIFGGRSGEHEVSLMSARSVLAALDAEKYEVTQIGIAPDGSWWTGPDALNAFIAGGEAASLEPVSILPDPTRPGLYHLPADLPMTGSPLDSYLQVDVIIPVLHGTFGEDGTVQGLLELADIAYVGAGVLSSALGMDKAVFRDVMHAHHIPVVETLVLFRSQIERDIEGVLQQAEGLAPYPLFVKPANLGSSVGISKCLSRADLMEGLFEAARFDRKILVERGLDAREIEVSILGNEMPQASLPGEILPSREFYSYEAKYIDGTSGLKIPAPLSAELTRRVQDLALMAYQAIDCAGMARVDFLLEKRPASGDGLYLSEINTIPGFTEISMYAKLWAANGLNYAGLLDQLIQLAVERKADRDRNEHSFLRDRNL
jgi:D-alanine-D-alanine ligase